MTTAKEYRAHAKKCFIRAQETESEELRQASLEMASYWMDASMRTECLGDNVLDLSKIEAGQLVLELSDYCIQDIAQTAATALGID
jgi:K+-sensing histidine kinase KdpD